MFINGLDYIAMELAGWDFWSIVALLMIILGICEKNLRVSLGFTIFVFKILGVDWGVGFVVADALLLCLSWYQSNQIKNAVSFLCHEFEKMMKEIRGIGYKCKKIRRTVNPDDTCVDELPDDDV